jgi:hypothetical protein
MRYTVIEYIEVDYNRIAAIVQLAVSVLWRLKFSKQFNLMSTQYRQDQFVFMAHFAQL